MANVNLLSQLAGSVAPKGEQFSPVQAVATGQELQMNDAKMLRLRQQLDMDQQDAVKQQRVQEIMQRVAAGEMSMQDAGTQIMADDPRTGMGLMQFGQKQTEFAQGQEQAAAEQEQQEASRAAIEKYALENGIDPAILMMDPSGAVGHIQKNLLAPPESMVASAPEYGLSPVYFTDEAGNLRIAQLSKGGGTHVPDIPGTIAPGVNFLNTETGFLPASSRTGQPMGGEIPINIRGAAEEKARGELSAEHITKQPKIIQQFRELSREWDIAKEDIAKAIEQSNSLTSGWAGKISSFVPGTPGYELKALLESIKARIGFNKLQQMRESSPTGGALGQVSNFENQLLQAVQGSLDQGQTAETLRYNLGRILELVHRMENDVAQKYEETYQEPIWKHLRSGNSPIAPSRVQSVGGSGNIMAPATADAGSEQLYTQENIEFTAKKHGMSVDEVKRQFGIE